MFVQQPIRCFFKAQIYNFFLAIGSQFLAVSPLPGTNGQRPTEALPPPGDTYKPVVCEGYGEDTN